MTKAANLANLASNTNFGILNIYRGGTGVGQFNNPGVLYYDGIATTLLLKIAPVSAGGTGMNTFPMNAAIYANSTTMLTAGVLPTQGGGTGLASFNTAGALYALNANTLTTGTLPTVSGGTGNSGLANNALLVGHGFDPVQTIAPGAANNVLISDGTQWYAANAVSRGIGIIPKPTAANNILVDTGIDWVSVSSKGLFVNPGNYGNVMVSDGSSWTSSSKNDLYGPVGAAGNVLTSNGTSLISSVNPTVGAGQSWTNMLSNRALGTAYTNTTNKPIMISLSGAGFSAPVPPAVVSTPSTISLSINGVVVSRTDANNTVQGIVPAGSAYIASTTGTVTLVNWAELR
jgi:hypothetical protein